MGFLDARRVRLMGESDMNKKIRVILASLACAVLMSSTALGQWPYAPPAPPVPPAPLPPSGPFYPQQAPTPPQAVPQETPQPQYQYPAPAPRPSNLRSRNRVNNSAKNTLFVRISPIPSTASASVWKRIGEICGNNTLRDTNRLSR